MVKNKFLSVWLLTGAMFVVFCFTGSKSFKRSRSIPAREVKPQDKKDLFLENVSLIRKIKASLH